MSATSWAPRLALPVSPARDHVRGPADATLSLVEYGDYQCPYCGVAHLVVHEVLAHFGQDLQFVFRHFPLTTVHPFAEQAAEAAEAAGAQGKFWAMHDLLYNNQERLAGPYLLSHAKALGLEISRFVTELSANTHAPRVREDFISGVRSGVNGTPSFFINGARYDGSWELPSLVMALREAASSGPEG